MRYLRVFILACVTLPPSGCFYRSHADIDKAELELYQNSEVLTFDCGDAWLNAKGKILGKRAEVTLAGDSKPAVKSTEAIVDETIVSKPGERQKTAYILHFWREERGLVSFIYGANVQESEGRIQVTGKSATIYVKCHFK